MSKLKIYACNGVGSTAQSVAKDIEDSGWYRNETLRKYLGSSKDGGCATYFLYTFIPEDDLAKYNVTIYNKRKSQLKTLKYVRELFVGHDYGTEQDLLAIIRKGVEDTFDMPVENVLMEIRTGKRESVGLAVEIVAAIISAIVSIVLAVISGVIAYAQTVKIAKYTAPTYQELEDSAPAATDFTKNTKKKGLLVAAIAGAALFVVGLFNNRN